MFSEAVRVRGVLAQAQNSVVVKQAIKHIEGFAGATGDDPCSKDAELVRHVSVNAHCTVIVAEVTGIEGGQQRALLNACRGSNQNQPEMVELKPATFFV